MCIASKTKAKAVSRLRRLAAKSNGNVSILFGLSLVPALGLTGLGIDYGLAFSARTKLDSAADAAALAAVVSAKAYIADNPGVVGATDKAIALGKEKATNVFRANVGTVPFTTVQLDSLTLTRSGQTFSSRVAYSGTVTSTFGRVFGTSINSIANQSEASTDVASYLDFYLMVDVSGSMGLPSTPAGMSSLAAQSRDMYDDYKQGCQFACHFPGYKGWDLAAGKIKLRSDSVNSAVCDLLNRATIQDVNEQYRIGIYPFINQLTALSGISSNIPALKTAADCGSTWPMTFTKLLDTGVTQLASGRDPTTGLGSGGTHFERALPQLKNSIRSFGNGSSVAAAKPFVFIVTDGMQNDQNYFTMKNNKIAYSGNPSKFAGYADAWWDGSQPKQMNPALCDEIKKAGGTIAILHIPYINIQFVDKGGGIAWENNIVNGFSPGLSTPLKACASANSYFKADTPEGITQALSSMFDQALQVTRLTQ